MVNPRISGIHADSGFPTKIGEYFAAKKPVVATKVGDLQFYFKNEHELIFAEPNDPKSIASGIRKLIEHPEMANKISANCYEWAINNLDYIENSRRLLKFVLP